MATKKRLYRDELERKAQEASAAWLSSLTKDERAALGRPPLVAGEPGGKASGPLRADRYRVRDDVAAEFEELSPSPWRHALERSAGRLTRKQETDRDHERRRVGKRHRLAGFSAKRGPMTEVRSNVRETRWTKPSRQDRAMVAALAQLVEAAQPLKPEAFCWPDTATERRMRARRGMVPEATLARARAAHSAAFGDSPARWESMLRALVEYALRYRLGNAPLPTALSYAKTGRGIVDRVRRAFPEDVPKKLAGSQVDRILMTSTLTRGGGRGGKKNVNNALDELLVSLR